MAQRLDAELALLRARLQAVKAAATARIKTMKQQRKALKGRDPARQLQLQAAENLVRMQVGAGCWVVG